MKNFDELSQELQKKIWEQARKNTKTNSDGKTVISRDDDDFDDDVWEGLYK